MPNPLDDLRKLTTPDERGCWIWQGGKTGPGYGVFYVKGRQVYAHRVVTELTLGPCPEGQEVMHSCDVRACINPQHLTYGTRAQNLTHMRALGRGPHGESHGRSKLTVAQVVEIRRLRDAGETLAEIAGLFGVSTKTAWAIVNRLTWKHV